MFNALYNVSMALNIKPFYPLVHPEVTKMEDQLKLSLFLESKSFDVKKESKSKNSHLPFLKKKHLKKVLKRYLNII